MEKFKVLEVRLMIWILRKDNGELLKIVKLKVFLLNMSFCGSCVEEGEFWGRWE